MKVIYKYGLYYGWTSLFLPKGAKVLSFQIQDNNPVVYMLCDTVTSVSEQRDFAIIATGQQFDDTWDQVHEYIGTQQDGHLMWHLFEKVKREVGPSYAGNMCGGPNV